MALMVLHVARGSFQGTFLSAPKLTWPRTVKREISTSPTASYVHVGGSLF